MAYDEVNSANLQPRFCRQAGTVDKPNYHLLRLLVHRFVDGRVNILNTVSKEIRALPMPEIAIFVILCILCVIVLRLIASNREERHKQLADRLSTSGDTRTVILRELLEGKALDVPPFVSAVIIGFDRGMTIIALTDAKGHVSVVEWSEGFARRFLSKADHAKERFSSGLLVKQ
jgi:hypothetical protein